MSMPTVPENVADARFGLDLDAIRLRLDGAGKAERLRPVRGCGRGTWHPVKATRRAASRFSLRA